MAAVFLFSLVTVSVGTAQVYGNSGANAAHPDGAPQPSGAVGDNRLGTFGTARERIEASHQDKAFLNEAAQENSFEVKAAQLATERGGSEEVKQFARQMAEDHASLTGQLQPVLGVAGVKPPKDLTKFDKAAYAKLDGLQGEVFDQAYIAEVIRRHQKDLQAFQEEADHGQLPSEKTLAASDLPFLQAHLKQAQMLAQAPVAHDRWCAREARREDAGAP